MTVVCAERTDFNECCTPVGRGHNPAAKPPLCMAQATFSCPYGAIHLEGRCPAGAEGLLRMLLRLRIAYQ